MPTWQHPRRIFASHSASLRLIVGSCAEGRVTNHAANPSLTVPSSFQMVLPPTLAQIYISRGPVLPLMNYKIHQLRASVLLDLPLRRPTTFCNLGSHLPATSRP